MAAKEKPKPDEFCDDGTTRKLNRTRPHATIYADGYSEAKYWQDEIAYRGDGTPVGYIPAAKRGLTPVEPTKEEVVAENESLRRQVNALLSRVEKLEQRQSAPALPPREAPNVKGATKP